MTRKFFSTGLSILCFALILCALTATLGMQLLGDLKTYVQISLKNVEQTTPKIISKETGVPRPTINQVINKLLELKMVERIGQGATTRYRKV